MMTRTRACGKVRGGGERPGEVGPLSALGSEAVRPAREEGGVAAVGHPRFKPLGEVRGRPGGAPFVEGDDACTGRHGAKEPLALVSDRCGRGPALARGRSPICGRDFPEGEPAGGGAGASRSPRTPRPPIAASGVPTAASTIFTCISVPFPVLPPCRSPSLRHGRSWAPPLAGSLGRAVSEGDVSASRPALPSSRGQGDSSPSDPPTPPWLGRPERRPRSRAVSERRGAPDQGTGAPVVCSRSAITGDQSFSSW